MKHIRLACLLTLCVLSAACGAGSSQQAAALATDVASSGSAAQHPAPVATTPSEDTSTDAVPSAATDTVAAPPVPEELKAFVPLDMKLLVYKTTGTTDGSDALAVLEKQKKNVSDPDIISGQRRLLVFRRENGALKEVARNENIIACSTCGWLLDDPSFIPEGVELTPGRIRIEQADARFHPSYSKFVFTYDAPTQQWRVASSEIGVSTQDDDSGDWKMQVTKLPPSPIILLADFDPKAWRKPEYWNAIPVNEKTHEMASIFNDPGQKSLNKDLDDACRSHGMCTVLVKQLYGCLAVVRDSAWRYFTINSMHTTGKQATDDAMRQCTQHGKGACKVEVYGCSVGFD